VLGLLALALIAGDIHFGLFGPVRYSLSYLSQPIHWLADIPSRLTNNTRRLTRSRSELMEENDALRIEMLVLRSRLQTMASVVAENSRLRELLRSSAPIESAVLVSEITAISPDPRSHSVWVNRGGDDGVIVGQPVIDAHGLMGQVVEVLPSSSRVLLITDPSHAVPVRIGRNGVRAIAEGTGLSDVMDLPHVAATVDIQEGDLLETSGLGGRFPGGYPVARVTMVKHDPGKPFLIVRAQPTAWLDRSRYVLIVFRGEIMSPAAAVDESAVTDSDEVPSDEAR
jgi:rod shape-determining protein MreC